MQIRGGIRRDPVVTIGPRMSTPNLPKASETSATAERRLSTSGTLPVPGTSRLPSTATMAKEAEVPPPVREVQRVSSRYVPWSDDLELFTAHNFCPLADLRNFVHTYLPLPFSVHSNRARVLQAIIALRNPAPFSETTRFPERGFYADLDGTSLSPIMSALIYACDAGDRAVNVHGQQTHIQAQHDIRRSYEVNFQQLHTIVYCCRADELTRSGVLSRRSFEQVHTLSWV